MSPVFGLLAVIGLLACTVLGDEAKLTVVLDSFKMCPEYPYVPSTYDNLALSMDPETRHTLYIDGVLNVKEEIPAGVKVVMDVRKCLDEREISCEKFMSHEVKDICSYIPQKDQWWTEFVTHIEGFSPDCPIQTGSYTINEAPIDVSEYQNESYSEFTGHWQVEISFVGEKGKRYGCVLMDGTVSLGNRG